MPKPRVRSCGWAALGVCVALLGCKVAKADFQWALSQFDAGHYDAARAEFLALAPLGNGNAQYDLGAMSLKGQGGPASKGTGVGWLLAAAENGYEGLSTEKLQGFKASLSEAELHDAQKVLDVYGHEALLRSALPSPNLMCPGLAPGRPRPTNDPFKEFIATHTALILVAFTVGADGHVRDPELRAALSDMTADALAPVLFEPLFRSRLLPDCNKGEDPRKFPWLRYAAASGEASADLDLAQALLNQTPSPEQLTQIKSLLQGAATSDSFRAKKHAVALLAASPIEAIRLPTVALEGARALSSGPIQSDPQMFEAVAAAQAANGDFEQAEAQQQIALTKAKALGWNTRFIEERLDSYRNKKAWYGDIFAVPAP